MCAQNVGYWRGLQPSIELLISNKRKSTFIEQLSLSASHGEHREYWNCWQRPTNCGNIRESSIYLADLTIARSMCFSFSFPCPSFSFQIYKVHWKLYNEYQIPINTIVFILAFRYQLFQLHWLIKIECLSLYYTRYMKYLKLRKF